MPDKGVSFDQTMPDTIDLLFQAGEKDKAIEASKLLGDRAEKMASYLIDEGHGLSLSLRRNIFILSLLQCTLYENGQDKLAKKFEDAYDRLIASLQMRGDLRREDR